MAQTDNISFNQTLRAAPFILPFMLVFVVFIGWPVFYSLWLSLHRVTIYSDFYNPFGSMEWVGIGNYGKVLADPVFWWSVVLTFGYALLTIAGGMVLSLALALQLRKSSPTFGILRTGFFLPNVFDVFVVGVIWLMLYNPNGGLVTAVLKSITGAESVEILSNPWLCLPAIALVMVLKNAGFGMVLFIVSLNNMNQSVFEAADVDGASPWQKLRHITLPLLKPIILFLIITGLVGSLNAFSEIYALTDGNGGPPVKVAGETLQAARISGFHLYMVFRDFAYGEAAAISFVLLFIALIISAINFKFLSEKD